MVCASALSFLDRKVCAIQKPTIFIIILSSLCQKRGMQMAQLFGVSSVHSAGFADVPKSGKHQSMVDLQHSPSSLPDSGAKSPERE